MPGQHVKTRTGRPPKFLSFSYDQTSERAFTFAGFMLQRAERALAEGTLSMHDQLEVVRAILPLALKRIPDRHEVVSVSLTLDDAATSRIIQAAERNLLLQQELCDSMQGRERPIIITAAPSASGEGGAGE